MIPGMQPGMGMGAPGGIAEPMPPLAIPDYGGEWGMLREEAKPDLQPEVQDKKLSADTLKKMARRIVDDYQRDQSNNQTWRDKLREWWNAYNAKSEYRRTPWDGACGLHVPMEAIFIDAIVPRIVEALFGTRPFVHALPRNEISADQSKAIQNWITWRLVENVRDLKTIWTELIQNMLIEGAMLARVRYRKEYDETGKMIHSCAVPEPVALDDTVTPATAHGIQSWQSDFVGQRLWMHLSDLEEEEDDQGKKVWTIDDDVRKTAGEGLQGEESEQRADEQERQGREEDAVSDEDDRVMLIEQHRRWRAPGDKHASNWVFWVAYYAQKVVRYARWRRRFRPHIYCPYMIRPRQFGGMGIPEILEPLSKAMTMHYRQDTDRRSLIASAPLAVPLEMKDEIESQGSQWKPGGRFYVSDTTQIKRLFEDPPDPGWVPKQNELWMRAEQRLRISEYHMGRESATNTRPTAAGTEAIIAEGNIGIDALIDRVRESFIDYVRIMLEYDVANMPDEGIKYKVCGADGKYLDEYTMTADELELHWNCELVASSVTMNKQLRKQETMGWSQAMMGFPFIQQNVDAQYALAKRISQEFDIKDFEEYVPPPPKAQNLPLAGPNTSPEVEEAAWMAGIAVPIETMEEGPQIEIHFKSHSKFVRDPAKIPRHVLGNVMEHMNMTGQKMQNWQAMQDAMQQLQQQGPMLGMGQPQGQFPPMTAGGPPPMPAMPPSYAMPPMGMGG